MGIAVWGVRVCDNSSMGCEYVIIAVWGVRVCDNSSMGCESM